MTDLAPESPSLLRRSRALAPPLLAAAGWTLLWMALETWFQRRGVGPMAQALAPLGVCLLGAAVLAFVIPAWGRRILNSRTLPGSLIGVLLLALGAGVAVVRARGGEVLPGSFLHAPFSLLATARLSDLARSLWLESLLLPLAGLVLARAWAARAAWASRPDHPLRAGGLLLLAGASLWNRAGGQQASQWVAQGATAGVFQTTLRPAEGPLTLPGFRIRLAQIQVAPSAPAFRLALLDHESGASGADTWTCPVESGQAGALPGGLRYRVEKLIPDARPSGQVAEDPQGPPNPAVQVMLGLGSTQPLVGVLFAQDPAGWRRDEPQGRFAVVYRDRFDPALLQALRPHPPTEPKLVLGFMGKTLEHPARLGEVWNLPGFSLTVTGIYPDFGGLRKGPAGKPELFSRTPFYRNPWIQVQLRQASGASAPLLLSALPVEDKDYGAYLARVLPPGMTLTYDPVDAELQDRFVLITREDQKIRLLENGRVVRTEDLALDKPFVVEKGLSVTVLSRYDHARFEPDFVPNPDVDANAPAQHPVLRVRVWDPATGAAESHWLQASGLGGQPVGAAFLGGRVRLDYRPKGPDPRDLSATLAVTDAAGTELARGACGTGAPLVYQGFRFYVDGYAPGPP
ncbi:MAG: hypothetical protein KGI56_06615, partial [Acidobacteriota bacterium]|nr:hypothetical protein [Acidobacteriota bacterium]